MESHSKFESEKALLKLAWITARGEGLSCSDAEDVASFVLMRYVEARDAVRFPAAWVRFVARRNSWTFRRQESVYQTLEEYDCAGLDTASPLEDSALERRLDLRAALAALSSEERQVVFLRDVAGDGILAIADKTGHSTATVKRRLRAGRASLRRALTGESVGGPLRLAGSFPVRELSYSRAI